MARLHHRWITAAALVAFGISGIGAAAQTRPSGDWFRDQGVRPPDQQEGPGGAGFDQRPAPPPPNAAGGGGGSDFPDAALRDWVVASARVANTRAIFRRAERDLDGAVRAAQRSFEESRDYQEALAAEKQAYDAYTGQRQHALESVVNDPKYKAAIDLRDEMGRKIAHLRATAKRGEVPKEMLLAMASQKLQFAADAHAMETAALEKDSKLQDDRQKMVQASGRVSELRSRLDASIRNDPRILEARRHLEDARVALITAEAYWNAATTAGALATDYAYYRHQWDFVRQGNGLGAWGPWGYQY